MNHHMDAAHASSDSPAPTTRILLRRWLDNYLNSGIDDGKCIEIRYINAVSLIGTLNIIASVIIEMMIDKPHIAAFMLGIALVTNLNVLYLRRSHNTSRAATNVLLIMLVMLNVMLIDGMYQNTASIWLGTFPAAAFFFKGKYHGMRWFSAMLGLLLGIMLLQAMNYLHTPYTTPALGLILVSVATIGMIVFVYESLRAKAEASLRQTREKLHQLAHTDMLTGLPNRTDFYNRLPLALQQARQSGEHLAVLFIDLDDFKPINDTYGHETGDKLLQQAAARLQDELRHSDFIARFGGDEFTAILPGVGNQQEVAAIANKLIAALSSPFTINGHHCRIGVSIGIGLFPDCADDVDTLVQLADHAMYMAKLDGKNSSCLCPAMAAEKGTAYKGNSVCSRRCPQQSTCQPSP